MGFVDKRDRERAAFAASQPQRLPAFRLPIAESEADRQEREATARKRAQLRATAELRGRWNSLLTSAGHRYRDSTLETFKCSRPRHDEVVKILREYVAGDCASGIVLYGPVGTGKDHLAFAVCRLAIMQGKTVRWVNGQQWFGLVRDAIDTSKTEASLISDLTQPDLLCLSDPLPPIGALTQHQATMLYRVVDARYCRAVPTICTVNVKDGKEADERMGAATWDRLTHDAWRIHCSWPTYRKPQRDV